MQFYISKFWVPFKIDIYISISNNNFMYILRWPRPFGQFCGLDKLYPIDAMPAFGGELEIVARFPDHAVKIRNFSELNAKRGRLRLTPVPPITAMTYVNARTRDL